MRIPPVRNGKRYGTLGRVIEPTAVELRRLLDGVGRDLADFLALASDWVRRHLPDHAEPVIGALVRVLAVPVSGSTRQAS